MCYKRKTFCLNKTYNKMPKDEKQKHTNSSEDFLIYSKRLFFLIELLLTEINGRPTVISRLLANIPILQLKMRIN